MSKVIFKLTFKHPNFKDTAAKNVAHIEYIATRPGVDKSLSEADLRKELDKGIEQAMSDDETYLKYINERPQSHGLFGMDGIEDPEKVKEEIAANTGFIWRAVVSLKEEDAKELGYLTKDKWQDLVRAKAPDLAKEMGIKLGNLRWAGAVHMANGHPHVHLMIWEKNPEKVSGVISKVAIENIHKMYTDEVFKEEKFRIMNEKNVMRDLIRDLAKGDMGQAARLLMEVRETGVEIKALIPQENAADLPHKMPINVETELAEKIKHLAEIMPGKGRANLKFMPEDVKTEVRSIAEYLLNLEQYRPSLERYLAAVETNNKLYTGQDEALRKTRDNAYNDIRDRVSQIILKAAVESQRDNIFYVDRELADNAITAIKGISDQINLFPERQQVFKQVTLVLLKTGHTDEEISGKLFDYSSKENFGYTKFSIQEFVKNTRNDGAASQELNTLSSSKKIEFCLATLKIAGYEEEEAFTLIRTIIKNDSSQLEKQLNALKDEGLLKIEQDSFKLTNKGVEELLRVKSLDNVQKEIMSALEECPLSFLNLIENKNIFSNLYDKDPDEFKISRFDLKVRDEFGDENRISFKELETNIYERYTTADITDVDKAEQEIDILKKRIEKLCLNGYVELDKATGVYSFTPEGEAGLQNIPHKMEFTRFDANVTLSYIDKADNGLLHQEDLEAALHKEIVNQTAKVYYEKFDSIITQGQSKKYISIDRAGNITATQEGQSIGYELNQLNKFFKEADKGNLSENKIREICNELYGQDADKQFKYTVQSLEKQVEKGNVIRKVDGTYSIDPLKNDIKNFLYQIHKADGTIQKENLKQVLENSVPNKEADNKFKYLVKRLENLKQEGYVAGGKGEYSITEAGAEKRLDLLHLERDLLRKEIKYLTRLGIIENTDEGFKATEKYYKYMSEVADAKDKKVERNSYYFKKDISHLIDKTADNLNVGKIERTNQRLATGKYINGEYKELKTAYQDVRASCNVPDITAKTLNNLTTTLLVAGVSLEETRVMLQQWNVRSNSNVEPDKLNEIIDKAFKDVEDKNNWGKVSVVSSQGWNDMFKTLGVEEPPKWMYKGDNWKNLIRNGVGLASIINDIWKSAWKNFERERMQQEAQAEIMKKNQIKQQAAAQNKEVRVEEYRKSKDRNALTNEKDMEL
jgi:hypothetical protein